MNKKVRLENGYAKLATILGLKLNQKFRVIGGRRNPYCVTEFGIIDAYGYDVNAEFIGFLLEGSSEYVIWDVEDE